MFSSIYLKTLYNLRWQVFGWGAAVGFIAFITMVAYNSFDQEGIDNIVSSVPDSLKSLVGSVDDFKTIPGYIGQQIFGPNGYLVAIVAAIIIPIAVTAGEEDDKRLQTLITMPVTRSAIFCQKWLAVITAMLVLVAALVGATYLGLLIVGHNADFARMMQSALAFFLMNSAFATIAFSVAMFIGKKGASIALAAGYTALSFVVTSLAASVEWLRYADKFSILHYYNNPQIMANGLTTNHLIIMAAIIVVAGTLGWIRFRHRNIGV
jgi:ABC-2 type transport system permease protein